MSDRIITIGRQFGSGGIDPKLVAENEEKRSMAEEKAGFTDAQMEKYINDINKARKSYYEHYTNKTWGHISDYHLCIHSDLVGIEGSVNTILTYLENITE